MNNKMRICFVILGSMYSGAEVVLNRFLKDNNDIDPYFLLIYENKDVKKKFDSLYGAERIYSLNYKFKQRNITLMPDLERFKLSKKYKSLIKTICPDVIYINNTTETMLLGGRVKNIPNICHIHDMKSLSRSPIRIAATVRGIKKCQQAVTVSKACKNDWGLDMEVIYNGLSEDSFSYKKTDKVRNIGFIGTPIKRKGIDIIINSLESILNINDEISCSFAFNNTLDDSELNSCMNKLCEKYKGRIKILKNLSTEEVTKFYDNMDLILVPSRHDPLPTVIMEAEARGTLVIGSNADGIPELLNNKNEVIMDTISSEELISKIKFVSQSDINYINQLTDELFKFSKDRFSSKNKNEKLMKLINKNL